ncbi:DUF4177 domain-containing protein [Marivita geojedonensis]|uniref:DUF4177 domain-containing protein n=1 Tax=Marivita geojedonensis TaxID=1123756 RepID=UPI000A1E5EA9|nr:uncharacterized protein DUF4177 [Marivita geojedonensis]
MFEYKVVPAPVKGIKAKGVKTPEARFALGVEQAINELAAEGWEYQRSDVLPSTERVGLTGSETNWRTLLVFRRAVAVEAAPETGPARVEPVLTATPAVTSAVPEGDGVAESEPEITTEAEPDFEEGNEETRPA